MIVTVYEWPDYFENFVNHCNDIALKNGWKVPTVMNYELKPHGKAIKTIEGWYLRWDDLKYHTAFVLKWL